MTSPIEQIVADWLAEEAPARAPDRILSQVAVAVDRTRRPRFGAGRRDNEMTFSLTRLAAAAIVLIAVSAGIGWVGRANVDSPSGVAGPTVPTAAPTTTSAPSSSVGTSLESYRTARNAICAQLTPQANDLKAQLDRAYDPSLSPAVRATKLQALEQFLDLDSGMIARLDLLDPPSDVVAEHASDLATHRANHAVIGQEITMLRVGKLAEAKALDDSTDVINQAGRNFETKYGLVRCP
jgi:negative regulator of sigma E activity